MIERLRIRGLGVIDDAVIAFGSGLTVITGETGAGKTMLLTGLGLLAGAKADAQTVRQGWDRAEVDGEWCLTEDASASVLERLREAGASIDFEDGLAQVLIARAVAGEGRSRSFAGGRTVPVTVLQEVAEELVAVHGQADQMRLRRAGKQRDLLDRYAGPGCQSSLADYRQTFAQWRAIRAEVEELTRERETRERQAASYAIGIAEIEAISPVPGEDVDLDRQSALLVHAGALLADVATARDALVGSEDPMSNGVNVLAAIATATRALDRAVEVDPNLGAVRDQFEEISSIAADAAVELSTYAADIDADPARALWVEERRSDLSGLRRRYGATIDEVLAWLEKARSTLAEVSGDEERLAELARAEATAEVTLMAYARALSSARKAAASRFAVAVTTELQALAMPNSALDVSITTSEALSDFTPSGADEVEFMLQPHVGAVARSIGKGASGGELSRVMLAIEVVLAGADPVPTFVFDEVDAGIGGRAAVEVGRRLSRLARSAQVIVVTHLPQVAAFADQHVVIAKSANGQVTASSVSAVTGNDRVSELVRMLSGLEDTEAGLAHAQELLVMAAAERASA